MSGPAAIVSKTFLLFVSIVMASGVNAVVVLILVVYLIQRQHVLRVIWKMLIGFVEKCIQLDNK